MISYTYSNLNNHCYIYNTVNHNNYFIDPETKAQTQTMECFWHHVKVNGLISSQIYGKDNLKKNGSVPQTQQIFSKNLGDYRLSWESDHHVEGY